MASGRGRLGAAVLLVGGLALAGCDSGGAPGAAPMSTETPTPSAAATAPPEVTPPAMPDAATEATDEGASAFVRHYFELVEYGYTTGDATALEAVASPECVACAGLVSEIRGLYARDGTVHGGEVTVADVSTPPGDVETGFRSLAVVSQEAITKHGSQGDEVVSERLSNAVVEVFTRRDARGWRVMQWGEHDAG